MKYIIQSTTRAAYFAAIHSYTPVYLDRDRAKQFETEQAATEYARRELFTDDSAFKIEPVTEPGAADTTAAR